MGLDVDGLEGRIRAALETAGGRRLDPDDLSGLLDVIREVRVLREVVDGARRVSAMLEQADRAHRASHASLRAAAAVNDEDP